MVKAVRRLVLEQFGYIDVDLELDMGLEPDQIYEFAMKFERNLDAYKGAFWDLMKEKKQDRLDREAQAEKEAEKQKVEDLKEQIKHLIENEPDAVKAKLEEFNHMIDETTAATLILKDREEPAPSAPTKTAQKAAPKFPETMTFFKGKYGWTLYTDVSSIQPLLDWLLSVPMEERGRKTAQPKLNKTGKGIYCNDKEKAIIEAEAQRQGTKTFDKEE